MRRQHQVIIIILVWFATGLGPGRIKAANWPMWRCDASRSASSGEPLAGQLHLQWALKLPKPQPAWRIEQYKLQFDLSYEPVVMGKTIFVPSMVTDSLTACDTDTGVEKWRFYCDGPVRFAPVAWRDRVCFVSDDGYLYCLRAGDGSLLWKFRDGGGDRKVLGNDRLISMWPARGAPVIYDDIIYFAAGIWPFMGTFIHALDAETGAVIWTNSSTGPAFVRQPHGQPGFSGVAPQGYIAATEDKLIVTGGRARPAAFDRKTGKLLYFKHDDNAFGKFRGGYDIAIFKDWFFNFGVMYNLADGGAAATASAEVMSEDAVIGFDGDGSLMAYAPRKEGKAKGLWKTQLQPPIDKIYLQAGRRLYGSGKDGLIAAIDIPEKNGDAAVSWTAAIEGEVFNMLAADGKLFVVTTAGTIYCFGPDKGQAQYHEVPGAGQTEGGKADGVAATRSGDDGDRAGRILAQSGQTDGYCLMLGLGSGEVLEGLIAQSRLHVIVLEGDAAKVSMWRRRLSDAGLYGRRAVVIGGDINSVKLPPYFAGLVISENPKANSLLSRVAMKKLFESVRPYGGSAFFADKARVGRKWVWDKWVSARPRSRLIRILKRARLPNARISYCDGFVRLTRSGPLPGSADWTHQYGDSANTVCSQDQLVKAPLGLLWFGERAAFGDVLPRHGHGPSEQIVAGRLFIEGISSISARDVYTGRRLWKADLDELNTFDVYYDRTFIDDFRDKTYNQVHLAGANARGTNFVATADRVYVIQDRNCKVLAAATGKELAVFTIADVAGAEPAQWAYLAVYEDYLIAGAGFAKYSQLIGADDKWLAWARYTDRIASKRLVVMDRYTGEILSSVRARFGFPHNAIAVGAGTIFCMDLLPPFPLKRPGGKTAGPTQDYRLLAVDVKSGEVRWQKDRDVFGGWLGYSAKHDVLIQGDWPDGDRMGPWKNFDRIIAHRGADGEVLWDEAVSYNGPYILHDDTIITQRSQGKTARAFSLLTGQEIMRKHPLTGENVPWEYMRMKGCNTAVGSQHLLTFRSSAAGFFDLAGDGGTGNLGGFRSGCTSNLIVANGVLNAPDYTQGCTCSYQNQTSLALVHMPEADLWTFNTIARSDKPVRRVGINLGAPGDRMSDDGTLWLDYPSVGGHSPDISVTTLPEKPVYWRYDSSQITSGPLRWVTASGVEGLGQIRIALAKEGDYKGIYTVRLYFAEPEQGEASGRIFDVAIEGRKVLSGFDIVKAAGGSRRSVVREFGDVRTGRDITIVLTPSGSAKGHKTLLCGVELIGEGDM